MNTTPNWLADERSVMDAAATAANGDSDTTWLTTHGSISVESGRVVARIHAMPGYAFSVGMVPVADPPGSRRVVEVADRVEVSYPISGWPEYCAVMVVKDRYVDPSGRWELPRDVLFHLSATAGAADGAWLLEHVDWTGTDGMKLGLERRVATILGAVGRERRDVVVAAVRRGDRYLVGTRRRTNPGMRCMPGGKPEDGETLEMAVVRELLEETGMQAVSVRKAGAVLSPTEWLATVFDVEVARGAEPTDIDPAVGEWEWVPLHELDSDNMLIGQRAWARALLGRDPGCPVHIDGAGQ